MLQELANYLLVITSVVKYLYYTMIYYQRDSCHRNIVVRSEAHADSLSCLTLKKLQTGWSFKKVTIRKNNWLVKRVLERYVKSFEKINCFKLNFYWLSNNEKLFCLNSFYHPYLLFIQNISLLDLILLFKAHSTCVQNFSHH